MLDKKFNDNCVDTYNQVIYNKSKYLWERIELMVKKTDGSIAYDVHGCFAAAYVRSGGVKA